MDIQLGLCCMNIELSDNKRKNNRITLNRTAIRKTCFDKGIDIIKERALENVKDIIPLLLWNEMNGIRVLRLSSDMFPHYTDPETPNYNLDFCKNELKKAGDLAKKLNHRITFHPGQYNVVGTPHQDKFEKTINDLSMHAEILDLMGMGKDSVMVVHGGGLYQQHKQSRDEAKKLTKERWCTNFVKLPESVKNRLVLENCEKCFTVEDCLEISEKINIPVVYDTHHYECYSILHPNEIQRPIELLIPKILETWTRRNIKPKFHISEQGTGKCGHHSNYVEKIPKHLFEIPQKYGIKIDIMIEAKKKELAIKHLHKKYPELLNNYKNQITNSSDIIQFTNKLNGSIKIRMKIKK